MTGHQRSYDPQLRLFKDVARWSRTMGSSRAPAEPILSEDGSQARHLAEPFLIDGRRMG